MSNFVNPYIAGNPITGKEMFFGRKDVFEFVRKNVIGEHRNNVVVLSGERRTGKTSVLYQMRRHLGDRFICIFVDVHGFTLEGIGGFLWELASIIVAGLRRDYGIQSERPHRTEFMEDPRKYFEVDFLNALWPLISNRKLLLMFDEVGRLQELVKAGMIEPGIFEYLRHLMQHHEQLNFLFSLGSGLEEMGKEYSFLFNVALYKKITFLARDAATALITQPIQDYYHIDEAALERILKITSGHPYHIQLLCHSLFNRWQKEQMPCVSIEDVNAILDEAVERGVGVLQFTWEESEIGEKAVMAAIAVLIDEHNRPAHIDDIECLWLRHGVKLPRKEQTEAIEKLTKRDIIKREGRYGYTFYVELQRLWILKHQRLEWVKGRKGGVEETAPSWILRNRLTQLSLLLWALMKKSRQLRVPWQGGSGPVIKPGRFISRAIKGLRPFGFGDAEIFERFQREKILQECLDSIQYCSVKLFKLGI